MNLSNQFMPDHECGETGLQDLASSIIDCLNKSCNWVVWLDGPMGAGKTTLVRYILRELGLSEDEPVLSPTYTLINEYDVDGLWYAHMDLYRAETNFNFDELGLDFRKYKGFFVEWPEAPGEDETILPTHKIAISYSGDHRRRYQFSDIVR